MHLQTEALKVGTKQVGNCRGVFPGGEKKGAIVDVDGSPEGEGRAFGGTLTCEATDGVAILSVGKELKLIGDNVCITAWNTREKRTGARLSP